MTGKGDGGRTKPPTLACQPPWYINRLLRSIDVASFIVREGEKAEGAGGGTKGREDRGGRKAIQSGDCVQVRGKEKYCESETDQRIDRQKHSGVECCS